MLFEQENLERRDQSLQLKCWTLLQKSRGLGVQCEQRAKHTMLIVTTKECFSATGSSLFGTRKAKVWSRPRGARSFFVISMSCGDYRGCLFNEGQ